MPSGPISWAASKTPRQVKALLRNIARYETPEIAGFTASAAWGQDNQWDTAFDTWFYVRLQQMKFLATSLQRIRSKVRDWLDRRHLVMIRNLGAPIPAARENFRDDRAEAIKAVTGRNL